MRGITTARATGINRLTDIQIKNAKVKEGKTASGKRITKTLLPDGGGLFLRCQLTLEARQKGTKVCTKSWIFRGTLTEGVELGPLKDRSFTMGLGPLDRMPAPLARGEAARLREIIARGGNPVKERDDELAAKKAAEGKSDAQVPPFEEFAPIVIAQLDEGWRDRNGGGSEDQWESSLKQYVYPIIGNKALDRITQVDVLGVLEQKILRKGTKEKFWTVRRDRLAGPQPQ